MASLQSNPDASIPPETLAAFDGDELRARTFYEKYALRGPDGKQIETLPEQMWRRVAKEIASVEKTEELRRKWEENFYWLLSDWKFIPGGRILFGAGQSRRATLLNCYVLPSPEDTLESIFDTAKAMARTYSYGGGVGIDISKLRPKGSPVNNSAIYSTGATSFMQIYSTTTETIGQAGRRGALMITIDIEHPDVEDFINIKKDLSKVTHANISVKVTDAFMKAVEEDKEFTLHFENEKVKMSKTVRARDLWRQIITAAWKSAEPGVLFWDTVIKNSTSNYNGMTPISTNPCVLPDTLILGDNLQISSLTEGNRAIGFNGQDNSIVKTFVRPYYGEMMKIKAMGLLPIITTPEHPLLTVTSYCIRPKLANGNHGLVRKFKNLEWKSAKDVKPKTEYTEGDYVVIPRLKGTVDVDKVPMFVEKTYKYDRNSFPLNEDTAWLLGMYVAEGHQIHGGIGFSLSKLETGITTRIRQILEGLGYHTNIRIKRTAVTTIVYSHALRDAFSKWCGRGAINKHIPDFILFHRNEKILRAFLDGHALGDGYHGISNKKSSYLRLTTISKTLAQQLQLAYARLGILPTIYIKKHPIDETIEGRRVNSKNAYDIWVTRGKNPKSKVFEDYILAPIRKIEKFTYAGNVHNIQTTDNTYLVSNAVVHNCGEIPLQAGGCCCLGSVNLSKFVSDPFTKHAMIDEAHLSAVLEYATRFLDNVLDYNINNHPLPIQKEESERSRRIGVGITGLGDALIKLGIKYDSDEAIRFVRELMYFIKKCVYNASIDLAEEKGVFPAYDSQKHMNQPFIQAMPLEIRERMAKSGIRNVALQTVPPVGSGSIIAGCSSGIEPVFALAYKRRSKSLSQPEFIVEQPIVTEYRKITGNTGPLPDYFVTAHQIKPEMRVKMQAAIQEHIDQSISSTVNLPEDITVEEVERIYMLAYKMGCKGITVYREGSREGILETLKEDGILPAVPKINEEGEFERPKILSGKTLKLRLLQGSLYITANNDDRGAPKEIFLELGKAGSEAKADAEALGRLASLYLQSGGDVKNIIRGLKGIQGGHISWDNGQKLLSVPDALAVGLQILTGQAKPKNGKHVANEEISARPEICPECHEESLVESNGCKTCYECGFSQCD
jgi:ribonucleoside-diphosphate reductase alpha chain